MKLLSRTIIVLVVFSLATASSAMELSAPEGKTLTISGSAGLPGVMMRGFPGDPVITAPPLSTAGAAPLHPRGKVTSLNRPAESIVKSLPIRPIRTTRRA